MEVVVCLALIFERFQNLLVDPVQIEWCALISLFYGHLFDVLSIVRLRDHVIHHVYNIGMRVSPLVLQ